MPLPPISVLVACGSIVTSIKSSWELSRMLKRKKLEKSLVRDSDLLLETLTNAYLCGDMSKHEYDEWYDRFLTALAINDVTGLKKIWVHLDMVRQQTTGATKSSRGERSARHPGLKPPPSSSSSRPSSRALDDRLPKACRPPPLNLSDKQEHRTALSGHSSPRRRTVRFADPMRPRKEFVRVYVKSPLPRGRQTGEESDLRLGRHLGYRSKRSR